VQLSKDYKMYQLKSSLNPIVIFSSTEPIFENGMWKCSNNNVSDPDGNEYTVVNPPKTWTADNIRSGLTLSEKVKWDNNSTPEVITAKLEMATPQLLAETTAVLQMLVTDNVISQASMTSILG